MRFEDELTHLPNRIAFLQQGERVFAETQHLSQPLWVILLELENKQQLDESGCLPEALRQCADAIRAGVADGVLVARTNAAQFGLLLDQPFESVHAIYLVAENIRFGIRKAAEEAMSQRLSVAIGLASSASAMNFEAVYEHADWSLHQSRNTDISLELDLPVIP